MENVDAVASILIPFRCVCVCGGGEAIYNPAVCAVLLILCCYYLFGIVYGLHTHTHI